jgi:hypothetical protein
MHAAHVTAQATVYGLLQLFDIVNRSCPARLDSVGGSSRLAARKPDVVLAAMFNPIRLAGQQLAATRGLRI